MADQIQHFVSADGFMPHGMCYLWQSSVLGLHVVSDALITLAYFSIPFTLLYFVRKRADLQSVNAALEREIAERKSAERDAGLGQEAREYLVIIQRAIEDVAQTVARMKEFYRGREQPLALAPVAINDILEQVIALTRARWGQWPCPTAGHRGRCARRCAYPHVDGRAVAAAIKARSPSTPIVLLTGWGHRLIDENDLPPHVERVLSKPPKLTEVRAALADLTEDLS